MRHIARRSGLLAVAIAAALPAALGAQTPTIEELLQRLEQQEQAIKVLERKLEIQDEAAKTAAGSTPQVRVGESGYRLQSADGKNQLRVRGTLHFDGRAMVSDEQDLPDTWQLTRVRPTFEGTLGGIYDWRFMPDFGQGRTVIEDAYVTARPKPGFQVTAASSVPGRPGAVAVANAPALISRAYPTSLAPNRASGCRWAATCWWQARRRSGIHERLERRREQRGLHRCRRQQRQGMGGARVRHPFAESDSLHRAALGNRPSPRLDDAGRHGGTAAARRRPFAGPGDYLPLSHRHDAGARGRRRPALAPQFDLVGGPLRPARRVHGSFAGRAAHGRREPLRGHVDNPGRHLQGWSS